MPKAKDITALAPAQGGDLIARQHSWTNLTEIGLLQRARKASKDLDTEALWSLLEWHLTTTGGNGSRVSPNTLRNYRRALVDLVHWCRENNRVPHELRAADAGTWRTWLETKGGSVPAAPYSQPLGPSSVRVRVAAARALMRALIATRARRDDGCPFAGMKIKDPTAPGDKREEYSESEYARLVACARNPRDKALLRLGGEAGLRASELATITWGEADLPGRKLKVRGKGGKLAPVTLSTACRDALQALWIANGKPSKKAPIFGITRGRIHALVVAACKRARIPSRGVHALRHRIGTELYRQTGDIYLVAQHLRHSNIGTATIYAKRASRGRLEEALDKLGTSGA